MSYIEDRAFSYSMRETLDKDFSLSNDANYASLAGYFAFWNIADVLMLCGNNMAFLTLRNILNGQEQKLDGERVGAVKNAIEVMYQLGGSDYWNDDLVASMRGELDHFGGFEHVVEDSLVLNIANRKSDSDILDNAVEIFLTLWSSGVTYKQERAMALLCANAYLVKNKFVPIVITSEHMEDMNRILDDYSGNATSFKEFFGHQEFTSMYNYLAYQINRNNAEKE